MMTQEDRQLLLKDLCARLPYLPICHIVGENGAEIDDILTSSTIEHLDVWLVKPYLRPLSSMTEEECDMVEEILGDKCIFDFMSNGDIVLIQGRFSQNKLAKLHDYYNSIHVDYRGLIPKELAISTDVFNPYKD